MRAKVTVSRLTCVALIALSLGACNPKVPIYLTAPQELSGASVRVDDELVATLEGLPPEAPPEQTGSTANFKVSSGPHVITVDQAGYAPIKIDIDFRSDEEGYLDISRDQLVQTPD